MKNKLSSWDWWNNQSNLVKNLICLSFLFLLPVVLSPDTILGDKEFMANDIVQWKGGAESLIQAREKYGYEPLWAHNMYGGMPAYFISYALSVTNIDSLISQWFYGIFPAATFWVGLTGLFFLFRFLSASHFASVFGAITVAFTTYIPIIIGAGHNSKFYAFNFIPWLFLGFFMILNGKKNFLLSLSVFALALSLELRAGHPQVTYYFGIVLAIVWLFDTIDSLKSGKTLEWAKKTSLFAMGAFLAIMSVLQPYWSKSEFTPYSTRGGSVVTESKGLNIDYAFAWSQGAGELLTLIIPNSYGGASGDGSYWGPKAFTSGPHYFGAIASLFLIIALVFYKGKWKWPFLIAGILTVLFSLGNHLLFFNELMYHYLPYFSKFRTPEMWLIASVFSFAVLSVLGFDELFKSDLSNKKWLYVLGGLFAFGLIVALTGNSVLSFEKEGEKQQIAEQIARTNRVSVNDPRVLNSATQVIKNQLIPQRKSAATADAWRMIFLVLIAGGVLFAYSKNKLNLEFASIALVLLASFDMVSVGKRYIPHYSKVPTGFQLDAKVKQQLNSLDEFIKTNQFDSTGIWPYRSFSIASNPFNNAAPSYYYPSIGGYTAVKIGAFQDLIDQALYTSEGYPNTAVLSMLNVKYVPIPQKVQLAQFSEAYSDQNGIVLELNTVLPKAWFVSDVRHSESGKDALNFVSNPNFEPQVSATVEGTYTTSNFELDSTSAAKVMTYEPRKIEVHTKNGHSGFLVLSEVFYPKGWKAFIDGKETPIYKTNFVLRGIEVPQGEHHISFTFNPTSFELGSKLSWAGTGIIWLLLALGIFISYKQSDKEIES